MPYSADAAFIQEQWLGGCFPRENTLVLGSGFYCLFDLPYEHPRLINNVWMPALDYPQQDEPDFVTTLGLCTDGPQSFYARGGETAGYGGDGFLALQEKGSDALIWLIALRDTNPFNRVEIQDQYLHGESTSGVRVRIPIQRPDQLTLTWP
ncbi:MULTISPECIES: hypothetical protein [Pseudomonas]|jgi:hypothetical protein|uniref:hypothetical protein n=1 Tax=Pseudomonas TaxID=286 RepID=UPI000883D318|nr:MULTISPECIES: hypothetical protein [Pseudomonas]GED77624.1 hypothetical protein PFL02_44740 [Pseudomonas fluorescens]AQT07406.1 hypothetical protein H78_00680 [Pseudomonas protegens]MCS4264091.1 hypothetical protein [Pseudomonas sp. BIGb0176]MDF4210427.1 hypothetical protein [Pseudomonas protegens]MDK1397364.1 hypothetical protein [Pseudomonas protegens]